MNAQKMFAVTVMSVIASALGDPVVSDVTVRQRWPWSRKVDIDYKLAGDVGAINDIEISASNGTSAVNITSAALSGDVNGVEPGTHRITWDPMVDGYTDAALASFTVSLTAKKVPSYMIIDLVTGAKSYRYEWDNLTWCNTDEYKTTNMVFRHIRAGDFLFGTMKSGDLLPSDHANANEFHAHTVHVSTDYWMAVFETTQKQYETLMGENPSTWAHCDTRPVDTVPCITKMRWCTYPDAYNSIQFSPEALDERGFTGRLSAKAGVKADLPWEYQWEYAVRAGTHWPFFMENIYVNADSGVIGQYIRYASNTPNTSNFSLGPDDGGPARVGSYLPNNWGLYDTCGNVWEVCLDGYIAASLDAEKPEATDEFEAMNVGYSKRVGKGGGFNSGANWVRCSTRADVVVGDGADQAVGFRVVVKYEE